ncbi:TetR family transcriptional regulator [Bacillus sp. BRMEA1]|uniref:TetR/AcrR family transcriptional regulator n=1 Tax=Neobacillus endophyticus TaxID=2738405 RepID=UPI0015643FA3|nr:TetR family transcriptional regulator [Neobacillus endophyticus]NRD79975.1 TetR family transcriptional regulator [Neobacillus endophyticus]
MTPKISNQEKEKRRQKIIQAAQQVFIRKGYEASTMQDIVDETGMSRGWVYNYFSSKEEMMQAILTKNDEETEVYYQTLLIENPSIWKGLCQMMKGMGDQLENDSNKLTLAVYEYFISGWNQQERRQYLEQHYIKQHNRIVQFLQKGVDRMEFNPTEKLEVIGGTIISFFEGLVLQSKARKFAAIHEQIALFQKVLETVLQIQSKEEGKGGDI